MIEKCSSPTGDGNGSIPLSGRSSKRILRNVVPRQGTEIVNKILTVFFTLLRNVVPRQGTEIVNIADVEKEAEKLRNVVPRQGTEIL